MVKVVNLLTQKKRDASYLTGVYGGNNLLGNELLRLFMAMLELKSI